MVQFVHPEKAHGGNEAGVKVGMKNGELVFWGEWESESHVEPILSPEDYGPRFIRDPFCQVGAEGYPEHRPVRVRRSLFAISGASNTSNVSGGPPSSRFWPRDPSFCSGLVPRETLVRIVETHERDFVKRHGRKPRMNTLRADWVEEFRGAWSLLER